MENLFPEILSYHLLSPLLLRLIASIILLKIIWQVAVVQNYSDKIKTFLKGIPHWNIRLWQGITLLLGLVVAGCLLVGLYTQLMAIILFVISLKMLIIGMITGDYLGENDTTYILLLFIALSLFVTGSGLWAFDLPI